MLSRFSLCSVQGVKKCALKFQPASAITTSAAASTNHPPEYPPPSSKRDFVNFPRLSCKEAAPPVRLGFIPESWFLNFYPKTGYTGPYMFLISMGTYLHSKEILVVEHNMVHLYGFVFLLYMIHTKLGDKFGDFYRKGVEESVRILDGGQEREKEGLRNEIQSLEESKSMKDAVVEIGKAKMEIVHLQMEMSYRERVLQAYKEVKNKLDCKVELDNVERRAIQKNVVHYVLRNVMKSLTPDLEKSVMQTCISDLNALASKA